MSTDWLPGKRVEQLAMAKNWISILNKNAVKWSVPNSVETELEGLMEEAQDELADAMSAGRTAVTTAKCKAAFDKLTAKMRDIKDRYYKKPPLADPDYISLGLKPKDTIKTPVPPPTGQAEANITYPGPHLLMLHIKPLAGTTVDPRADYGYRIYYGLLPPGGATTEQATGPKRYLTKASPVGQDLPHSKFTKRQKELFDFPSDDSGKTVYFCIRYENSKGQAGPWGPVCQAIIP